MAFYGAERLETMAIRLANMDKRRHERMSVYQRDIEKLLWIYHAEHIAPRHIEGLMRSVYHTLDALSEHQFRTEVKWAIGEWNRIGRTEAEAIAASYGL